MSRQNFWDVVKNAEINPMDEVRKIETLFSRTEIKVGYSEWSTIEDHINNHYFLDWKYRNTCLNISDLRKIGNIPTHLDLCNHTSISREDMFLYFEFIINMILLIDSLSYSIGDHLKIMIDNIKNIIDKYNCKFEELEDNMHVIVEKSEKVTAVSELHPEIAPKVIEYNRVALKGNLQKKRELLVAIAHKFEGVQKVLKAGNKSLFDDVTCLLNSVHLRHNNKEGHKANQAIIEMADQDLENWYDKTYDTLLLALLYADYVGFKGEIKELKKVLK